MPTTKSALQTEFEFTLPQGYVDSEGKIHCTGTMRLATAMDEIAPLRDPRVRNNQAYLTMLILAHVITKLGDLTNINAGLIESLFTADVAYLQDFYRRINSSGTPKLSVTCPECNHTFEVEEPEPGGS